MGAGVVVTNGIVPPAPGPMFVADKLGITMGHAILTGITFGLLPALAGLDKDALTDLLTLEALSHGGNLGGGGGGSPFRGPQVYDVREANVLVIGDSSLSVVSARPGHRRSSFQKEFQFYAESGSQSWGARSRHVPGETPGAHLVEALWGAGFAKILYHLRVFFADFYQPGRRDKGKPFVVVVSYAGNDLFGPERNLLTEGPCGRP
jgi:hypothetical protein